MSASLLRRGGAEFVGTALLLAAVVGSGIAAQRLSPHDLGLELLENAAATAAALVAIILALGPVSGAHLNPAVTLADRLLGGVSWTTAAVYWIAQAFGGALGTIVANLMFALPALQISTRQRSTPALWLAEAVATFGLVFVIFALARSGHGAAAPLAVGAYIAGAYWFTASTSFANPAVTLARMLSNTFAGIAPGSAPGFIAFQLVGALLAVGAVRLLFPAIEGIAGEPAVPEESSR